MSHIIAEHNSEPGTSKRIEEISAPRLEPHPDLRVIVSPAEGSKNGASSNCPAAETPIRSSASSARSTSRLRALTPTLTLENSGSVARDHLASERTWLAYVRTSLAIASTGVALVQLFTISIRKTNRSGDYNATEQKLERFVRPLGAAAVILALMVLGIGVWRYFRVQNAMTEGQFPVARKTVVFITAVLAALVAIVFSVLVAIPRRW